MSTLQKLNRILIDAYIRQNIKILLNQNTIIPHTIQTLIFTFYYITTTIYCITDQYAIDDKHSNSIFIGNIHGQNSLKSSTVNIKSKKNCIFPISNSYCSTTNFKPTNFPSKFSKHAHKFTNVIFRIGEDPFQKSHAIAIQPVTDTKQTNEYEYNAKYWDLPLLNKQPSGNSLVFNSKYQTLYSIGGDHNWMTYALEFDFAEEWKNINEEWKWKTLRKCPYKHSHGCVCTFASEEKLFIAGGVNDNVILDRTSIYDINENQWGSRCAGSMKLKKARLCAGVCYDKHGNRIYVGGGYRYHNEYENSVENMDMEKRQGFKVLDMETECIHGNNPCLWVENNGQLLYIASLYYEDVGSIYEDKVIRSAACEFMDLRECKKWIAVYKEDLLERVFGLGEEMQLNDCHLLI